MFPQNNLLKKHKPIKKRGMPSKQVAGPAHANYIPVRPINRDRAKWGVNYAPF